VNIIEAAHLVKTGILLRRSSWPPQNYMGLDECGLYIAVHSNGINLQRHFSVDLEEILADDWEIFNPTPSIRPKGLSLKK